MNEMFDQSLLLLDNTNVGIYCRHIAPDGKRTYVYFNQVVKSFFGCDDVLSSPNVRTALDDNLDTIALSTIEPYREEVPIRNKEGVIYRWFVFFKKKIDARLIGKDGYYIITSVVEVTNRKLDELELAKSRLNLRIATESAKMSTWDYDVATKVFTITNGIDVKKPTITLEEHIMLRHYDKKTDDLHSDLLGVISGEKETGHSLYIVKENGTGRNLYRKAYFMGIKENGKVTHVIGCTQDETQNYRFKEMIKKGKEELDLALVAGKIAVWNFTKKDNMFHTLYGLARAGEGLHYDDFCKMIHPDDAEMLNSIFNSFFSRKKDNASLVCRVKNNNGESDYLYLDSHMMSMEDDNHNITIIGTEKDVTEEYLFQERLKEKDNLNNLVVNHLLAGVLLFTKECQIVWSNESAKTVFAKILDRKNVNSGQTCEFMVNGKCTKEGACIINESFINNTIEFEERQIADDIHIELTAIPVIDNNGKHYQTLLKLRDISEAKNLLLELKRSKEVADEQNSFISILINRLPCAVFILNIDNDYRIEIANDMFCNTLNLSRSEIIGKNNEELFGKDIALKYNSYDYMLANGAEGVDGSVTYEAVINVDNKDIFFIVNKSLVTFAKKKYILSVSTDISDIKHLNAELIVAKENAMKADKLKSSFLANMSHEIRTPLNAIVGFSQLLADNNDATEKEQFCKIIFNNSQMLLRLIGDILDLSKIESGTTEFKRELVDVAPFFNELTTSLAIKVTNPDVKFIVDSPYKSCYVNMDKLRFGQVITNFVTNAIKYTYKGYIKVGYNVERHGILIKVEDTGVGIAANKRDRVFTRFDKLDSMAQGTGLGLSIAKLITESGNGKIWFESEEGKGTTFYSWKPFSDIRVLKNPTNKPIEVNEQSELSSEDTSALSSKQPIVANSFKRILIAEDNESNFILLQKMLKNYEIDWAKDGIEAVEKVAKYRYDLVLMDIRMPIMDGLDATRQIRKFNTAIPIVAVTANAFSMDEEEALRAGCNEFIAKPILKEDLINVMSKC